MARKKINFDTVRELGLALPDVEEARMFGSRALTVGGELFAVLATHRSADPNSLSVVVGFDQREQLIAEDPNTYYLPRHYVNYPVVLVRLTRVQHDALRDLLQRAWQFVSTQSKRRVKKPTRKRTKRN